MMQTVTCQYFNFSDLVGRALGLDLESVTGHSHSYYLSGSSTMTKKRRSDGSASRAPWKSLFGDSKMMGKTWSSESAPAAFRRGDLRSSNGSEKRLRVAFRNTSHVPLVLCWVSATGTAHHFYHLLPQTTTTTPCMVTSEEHVETSQLGHAFLFARESSVTVPEEEQASSRKGLDFLRPSRYRLGRNRIEESMYTDQSEKKLCSQDIVGGYCPKRCISAHDEQEDAAENNEDESSASAGNNESTSSFDEEDCRVQLVTISSRRRRRRKRRLRGPGRQYPEDGTDCWEFVTLVELGRIDSTPLDTSEKQYIPEILGGWPVLCEPGWDDESDDTSSKSSSSSSEEESKGWKDDSPKMSLRERLAADLEAASRHLPPEACEKLRKDTPIYINKRLSYGPKACPIRGNGMCFHPDKGWLRLNGLSENKCGGIELFDAPNYQGDCILWGLGGVMLHELSHAYHFKLVPDGEDNADVKKCYESAMKKGLYNSVAVHNGRAGNGPCRAYACNNHCEYFAELSTAFLGGLDPKVEHNKWFPFNRHQLAKHDPDAYQMLQRIWGISIKD
eukprot:scaffold29255_cov37-Attheya_sp.AAC.2